MTYESTLKTSLFRDYSSDECQVVLQALNGEYLNYEREQTIREQEQNRTSRELLLILSGMVQMIRYGKNGERFMIDYCQAGTVIGYSALYTSEHLENCAYVAGRKTTALRLYPENMEKLPQRLKEKWSQNLLAVLAERNVRLIQKGDVISRRLVRDRILAYLYYFSCNRNLKEFDIPLNRQELADFICVDRTTLSAELSKLAKEGLLIVKGTHFKLLKEINLDHVQHI